MIHHAVMRDVIQKRREARFNPVARPRSDELHPDFLEHLFGGGAHTDLAQHKAEYTAAMPSIQFLERRRVAIAVAQHQLLVGDGFGGHERQSSRKHCS